MFSKMMCLLICASVVPTSTMDDNCKDCKRSPSTI